MDPKSPTRFKQDQVIQQGSATEPMDSTQKQPSINIVQRKQQVMDIFQGHFVPKSLDKS
jgi:hypothetical protein